MTTAKQPVHHCTRRQALGLLGTAASAGLVAAGTGRLGVHAQQRFTSAASPTFPAGAIIRTLQGDLDPEELADGATLFHEHVGRGDIDLAVEELRAAPSTGLAASSTRRPAGARRRRCATSAPSPTGARSGS